MTGSRTIADMPFVALVFAVAHIGAFASGPVVNPPQAELLRLKPVLNRRLQFRMDLTIKVAPSEPGAAPTDAASGDDSGEFAATFLIGERVTAIDGDRITLRRFQKTEKLEGKGKGGEQMVGVFKMIGGGEYTVETDHRANVLSVKAGPTGFSAHDIDVVLPEKAISPGTTWTGSTGANPEISLRSTLRGIATVAGRRVALIDIGDADSGSNPFRVGPDSAFALDLADGRWLRMRAALKGDENGRSLTMTYAVARDGAPDWPTILAAFPTK